MLNYLSSWTKVFWYICFMRFIKDLSDTDISALGNGFRHGPSSNYRLRCQAILQSYRGKQIKELASFYNVDRDTISAWFNRWESLGLAGLLDKERPGRPPKLRTDNKEHVARVKALVAQESQQLDRVLDQLQTEFEIQMSRKTLKRFLKSLVIDGSVLEHQLSNTKIPNTMLNSSKDSKDS